MFWDGPQKGSEDTLGVGGWYVDENNVQKWELPQGMTSGWTYKNTLNPINGYKLGLVMSPAITNRGFNVKLALNESDARWRNSENQRVVPHLVATFPDVYLSEKQLNRRNELFTALKDYCEKMEAKFIAGDEALTDANLNKYFGELKKLGVEEYVKIYQDGYDAYLKNVK
ncbi:hypothetical protein D3C73_1255330 [compost metagenome]